MQLQAYFNFDGNCREAFEFYHQCLGGEITAMMTWREGPHADEATPEMLDSIMHASLDLGGGHVLMGSDSTPRYPYAGVTGASVTVSMDDPEEAERVFAALAEGGRITMPLDETFWAQRFGVATDRFGVPWMVNCGKEGWK